MFNKTGFVLSVIYLIVLQSVAYAQVPELLWTRTYGLPQDYCECWQAIATPDGGLIITGASGINTSYRYMYIVRIGSGGDKLWDLSYNTHSSGQAVCLTPEDGFIVAGYFEQNGDFHYIVKYDSSGNEVWSRLLNCWGEGALRSIQPLGQNGYILAGYETGPPGLENILLVRTDLDGDTLWSRIYGGLLAERAWSARPTSDGGFIVAGWTETYGNGGSDFYIIKTDSNGDSIWARTYGGEWNEEARDIMETPDGGFVFCGKRAESNDEPDYYLMKIDAQGDSVWAYVYHGFSAVHRVVHSFIQTQDGGYALIGYNDLGFIDIFKTDSEGDSLWSISYMNHPVIRNKARTIIQTDDGGYYLCGFYQDIWLARLSPEMTGIEEEIISLPGQIVLHQNYPNPFNVSTSISFTLSEPQDIVLSIYDLLGRKVSVLADGYYDPGIYIITYGAGNLTSGIYFYKLKAGDISEMKSMILLK